MGRVAALALAASLIVVPASLARTSDDVITITSGPSGETTETSATFTFSRSRGVAFTTCSLDGGPEADCSSPVSLPDLALGPHRFVVRAYDADERLLGTDSRSWTIVPRGEPGPGPGPDPEPSPSLTAKLALTTPLVAPGGLVGLDASASTGPVVETGFDLDGNGSYETKCESGKAGAVYSELGSYLVGVQVVSTSGQKSIAKETVVVAGTPGLPPSGAGGASPPQGTIVGTCLADAWNDSHEAFLCPKTVIVGVAEATLPPNAKSCFAFTKVGSSIRYVLEPSVGYAMVNGVWIWPKVGQLQLDATTKHVRMIGAGTVDIYKLGYSISLTTKASMFAWNVANAGVVGELHFTSPALKFLGLSVPSDLKRPLVFTSDKAAKLDIVVAAPSWFESIASSSVSLRLDNTEGLHIESFVVQLGGFSLGPFGVKGAKVAYTREGSSDVWTGDLTLTVPGDVTAGGQVRFENGLLDYLKLFIQKDNPGWPIGCCVFLTYLSGETDTSSYIKASAKLSAGPSLSTPWGTFRFASVDPASVKVSLGSYYSLEAEGTLKVVGKEIGGAYFAYFPGYLYFHGALNKSFSVAGVKVIEVGVFVQGSMKSSGAWYAGGSGSICVLDIDCAEGHLAVSNKGVSACLHAIASVGGYVRWNGDWDYFWSCSWDKVKAEAGAALRVLSASGASAVDVRIAPGTPRKLFRIAGRGAPPRVLVEGPGGRRIETSTTYERTSGYFVLQVPREDATYVAVMNPAAGRWRFTPLAGSVPIAGIGGAGPLPARMVRGTLGTAGDERVLTYGIDAPKGFAVGFFERGKDLERPLGRAIGKRGQLRFTPAESGPRTRRIEAVVESDGLAVRTEVVARFTAPPLRPLPAPRLALARQGTTVVARWLPVARASRYRVAVTPADGATRSFEVGPRGQTAVRVTGVGPRAGVVATVQALSGEGRPGSVARGRLAPEPSLRILSASRTSIAVRCLAAADGLCVATAFAARKEIGSASLRLAYGKAGVLRLRLRTGASAVRLIVDVPGEGPRTTAVKLR